MSRTEPFLWNRGRASLGLAPYGEPRAFRDTAGGGKPLPTGWTVINPAAEDGRPRRAAPYGGFRTSYGSGGDRRGFKAVAITISRMTEIAPVGAGLLTRPPSVDRDARRAMTRRAASQTVPQGRYKADWIRE